VFDKSVSQLPYEIVPLKDKNNLSIDNTQGEDTKFEILFYRVNKILATIVVLLFV
jgi:hypothetical protein